MSLLELSKKKPDGWINCELGEVLTLQRGYDLPHRLRNDGEVPIISSSGVSGRHDKAMVSPPGVVTGRYGTIGEIFYINEPFWPLNTTLYIRDFRGMTPEYAYHFLKTINFEAHSGKSGVPGVNRNDVHKEIVYFPINKNEQTAIVNILSDADALITKLEELIAKKQAIKTATMQQLLTGRTRLPQFSKYPNGTLKGYATGELGHIPVDWEVVTCGEIGKFRGGSGFPTSVQGQTSGKYPFYKVSDMNNDGNGIFMSDSNNWISSNIRKQLGSTIFPAGSIIFAKVGAAIFLERKKILTIPSCIDNNLAAFELDLTRCEIRFIHYILLNLNFGDYVSTTALPSLSGAVLSKIKIVLPSIKEQMAIASILSDMDAEIEMLEQKLAKFRDIKQGMMQQLLTGRIRLPLEQQP
ncbi:MULTISPECIES: restriction endonuclease subunit S [Enterobacteriaceae]|uniref:Restriction endonuclease subunit S n=7 Tax=Enterobacteriaceae TaxID=543 RepID=A0A828NX49_ECOLX|nr:MULTISPECIES: restriction endonuclease subunit S [Enterobacteriaceae]HAV1770601.1 restriction endonuclease subunit S [Enterobacter hormaechei subsp. xiangfangensis]EFM8153327.1 restriction endonuclease subunit S [Escherichia coli]EFO1683731.1 restriction endonuclease subunit S [Escherichia coli]EJC0053543.1 restriction endonuclease subunit S [Escherichia coli]EKY4998473.1 restriction endonuclease subunit S [Escherichia coli]